jgi:hypothetical protein
MGCGNRHHIYSFDDLTIRSATWFGVSCGLTCCTVGAIIYNAFDAYFSKPYYEPDMETAASITKEEEC